MAEKLVKDSQCLVNDLANDCISRQAAIEALSRCQTYLFDARDTDRKISLEDAEYVIEKLPSAEPQRMKGRWERHYSRPNVYADLCWHCSNCGYSSNDSWANKWKYCPNCGANMRGEKDG